MRTGVEGTTEGSILLFLITGWKIPFAVAPLIWAKKPAFSTGSKLNSSPLLYCALTLKPKVFLSFEYACLKAAERVLKFPPISSIEVPGLSIAFLEKKWTTPDSTPGPYKADAAPLTISTLSISRFDNPDWKANNEPEAGDCKKR